MKNKLKKYTATFNDPVSRYRHGTTENDSEKLNQQFWRQIGHPVKVPNFPLQ